MHVGWSCLIVWMLSALCHAPFWVVRGLLELLRGSALALVTAELLCRTFCFSLMFVALRGRSAVCDTNARVTLGYIG